MAKILTEAVIGNWIKKNEIIEFADINCAEGIKYDLRLGNEFLKSHFGRMVNFTELSNEEKRHAVIKPGEVVYVLTKERLNLPDNVFVQLSPKRKLSHLGIQLLGGLTIDPGYQGYLLFGLCNLSSTEFTLEPGKKLVGAVFNELSESETIEYKVPEPLDNFPSEVISIIKQYKPIESSHLSEEIIRVSDEVARIARTLESDNEWKSTFKTNLSTVTEKLTEISASLQVEIRVRKEGEETLKQNDAVLNTAVESINKNILSFKIWTKVFIAIFSIGVTIAAGLLVAFISDFF
jgi:dCTP deaminase